MQMSNVLYSVPKFPKTWPEMEMANKSTLILTAYKNTKGELEQ